MKITFYFDVFPESTPESITPYSMYIISPKGKGAKRYKVITEVPDPREPDEVITGKSEVL